MTLDDYKVLLYRNQPEGWVAEIPAIVGCYALMPTKEDALLELEHVFAMIAAEYRERGVPLPLDTTEIAHAWCPRGRVSPPRFVWAFNFVARREVTNDGFTPTGEP